MSLYFVLINPKNSSLNLAISSGATVSMNQLVPANSKQKHYKHEGDHIAFDSEIRKLTAYS